MTGQERQAAETQTAACAPTQSRGAFLTEEEYAIWEIRAYVLASETPGRFGYFTEDGK